MNQTESKNTYKTVKAKNSMEKKLLFIILAISIFSLNTAFSEDVCKYIQGQTIFRCNDAMPSLVIEPGTEQNITIYCCLTGDSFNNTNLYPGIIKILNNYTYLKEHYENDSMISEYITNYYNASKWITSYYLPENITGFQSFPVTLFFNTPLFDKNYKSGMILNARFDLSIIIPGRMTPQLAIIPRLMLPADYKPLNEKINIYFIGGAFVIFLLLIITFKNDKINQKLKRFFKKKKHETHQEIKEEPKHENKEEEGKKNE